MSETQHTAIPPAAAKPFEKDGRDPSAKTAAAGRSEAEALEAKVAELRRETHRLRNLAQAAEILLPQIERLESLLRRALPQVDRVDTALAADIRRCLGPSGEAAEPLGSSRF
jgi:chromosome segregation ATPase